TEHEILLGKRTPSDSKQVLPGIESVGFRDDEALLPVSTMTFAGPRLLEEYYMLPAKFAFVDVVGIGRIREVSPTATRFSRAIRGSCPTRKPCRSISSPRTGRSRVASAWARSASHQRHRQPSRRSRISRHQLLMSLRRLVAISSGGSWRTRR